MVYKWQHSTNTPTYNSWRAMRRRCNSQDHHTKSYRQKKITICKRWSSYDLFYLDMGERPVGKTLDRINNQKGYYPNNCRWTDWYTQQNNKAGLSKIKYEGREHTIGEWCQILKLSQTKKKRAYKRYSTYGCKSFKELFLVDNLIRHRRSLIKNRCLGCNTIVSCKWRKRGTECNTCYHRIYRQQKD